MSRASGQFGTLASLAFKDAAGIDWGGTDQKSSAIMEKAMAIGSSSKGGVGGFATNLYLNSAYTVGIIGELAVEEAAMLAAEFALGIGTFGSGGLAAPATVPAMAAIGTLMASRAVRAGSRIKKGFQMAGNLGKTLDNLKDINKAREYFVKGAKGLGNIVKSPIDNTWDFIKNSDRLYDTRKTLAAGEVVKLSNLKKTVKGFGEFYKDWRNARLAFGEGSLEGGMVQNQLENDLYLDFIETNKRDPTDEEALAIKTTAYEAGYTTTLINAPLILLSNKLTLPGLTGGAMKRMGSDVLTTNLGRKMIFNPRNIAGKNAVTALPKNYFKAKWELIKNPRVFASNIAKYSQANFAEGFQEVAQETVAATSEDYYKALYSGNAERGGYMNYMLENFGGGHGIGTTAETFLSGFLMGGTTAPLSTGIYTAMRGRKGFEGTRAGDLGNKVYEKSLGIRHGFKSEQYLNYKKEQQDIDRKREDELNNDVNTLNKFYADPNHYFSPAMENILEQKEYNKIMGYAQEQNDARTYYDMKDSSSIKHITTAMKYGIFDSTVERLSDIKNMTAEETLSLRRESQTHEDYVKEIDKSINHANSIKNTWDEMSKKYPSPFANYTSFRYGSPEYNQTAQGHIAWNKAIEEAVFNQATFRRTLARQKSMLSTVKDVAGLEKVAIRDLSLLYTQKDAISELDTLQKEINAFESINLVTEEAKKLFEEKKQKYAKLKTVNDALAKAITNSKDEVLTEEDYANVEKTYKEYMTYLAEVNGDFVNADNLDASLKQLIDYNLLTDRSLKANNAVNILLDPEGFLATFERIKSGLKVLHENREQEIRKSLEEFEKIKDSNKMLNELYEEGIFINPEDLELLETEGTVPDTFYLHDKGKVAQVPMTREQYKKAVGILRKHLKLKGIELNNINIANQFDPYQSRSRNKLPNDKRTYEDYAKQFKFDPETESTKVPLKVVLEAIVNSEFATEREIALAEKMLEIADDKETVTFSKGGTTPGSYSSSAGVVIHPEYSSDNFKQGKTGHPIEHVILHEEIHRRTVDSLQTDTEFKNDMQKLLDASLAFWNAMDSTTKSLLTGGDPNNILFGLTSLEDFVAETMSNETFQTFLAMVKTDVKTTKSAWVQFVDRVLAQLEKVFGKSVNGTVLNASLELITAKIDSNFGTPGSTGTTTSAPAAASSTNQVTSSTSISELKKEHPELVEELVEIYLQSQQQRKDNGDDYWENFDKVAKDKIVDTAQFRNFFSLPSTKKDSAIYLYNQKLGTTKTTSSTTPTTAPQNSTTTPSTKVYKTKTKELEDKIKALGYTKREFSVMTIGEANKLAKENIHKLDRIAAETVAKTSVNLAVEAEKQELIDLVNSILDDITDYDSWMGGSALLIAEVSSNPKYRKVAGIDGNILNELLQNKLNELAFSVNFVNVKVDNIILLNDKKLTKAKVKAIGSDYIIVEHLTADGKTETIKENEMEEKVKYLYSEALEKIAKETSPEITAAEKETAVQTVENKIGLEGIEQDIKTAEQKSKEDIDNDLLNSICK
jgi:hypothetical protein